MPRSRASSPEQLVPEAAWDQRDLTPALPVPKEERDKMAGNLRGPPPPHRPDEMGGEQPQPGKASIPTPRRG